MSCGDVKGDPVDSDADDVAGPDGEDVTVDTVVPDVPDDPVVPDVPDDPVVPDVPDDPVVPDGEDVVEEGTTGCEEAGGYCTSYPGSDGCVTCEDVGGTHYLPARGAEGAMECTATGGDSPYCCLPEDMTAPPACVEGGGGCYQRPGSGGNICPPGWVLDSTMSCGAGPRDCCVPGPDCT
jgi:hypothetical protein